MANNDTSYLNSIYTNTPWCLPFMIVFTLEEYVDLAVLILSAITFIIGLTSWIKIKRFGHFKNYVFLNIILNNAVNRVLALLFNYFLNCTEVILYIFGFCFAYFKLTVNYWLVVMCYLIYKDLVKVFGGNVERKYLKSNLFVWGLSFAFALCQNLAMYFLSDSGKIFFWIYITVLFLPLIINLAIYVRVLYALLKAEVHNKGDCYRRLLVSTIIFFINGTLLLLMPLQELVKFSPFLWLFLMHVQAVSMVIYFFVVRLNRTVWSDYFTNRKNSRRDRTCFAVVESEKNLLKRGQDTGGKPSAQEFGLGQVHQTFPTTATPGNLALH